MTRQLAIYLKVSLTIMLLTVTGCASLVSSGIDPAPTVETIPTAGLSATTATFLPAIPTTEQPTTTPMDPIRDTAPISTPALELSEDDALQTRPPNREIVPTATPTIGLLPPTAAATAVPPIDDALVFYATTVTIQSAPDQPATTSWAFRSLPPLPQFDPALFNDLYGPWQGEFDFSMFLANRQPQLSPDGQALLVPGLTAYPEYGVEGTGTWVIDVMTGAARQLMPDGVSATWNPAGDAITYGDGDTLFTLSTAEGATPQAIFQHPDLWDIYAKWSPDGQWIAAVTGVQHEPTGAAGNDLTFTYWLVPPGGGPARELAHHETYGAGYSANEASWSPNGQYLLIHNQVYDLAGNQLLPDGIGGLEWLPDRSQLLHWAYPGGLRVITVTGEEVALIEGSAIEGPTTWAFSQDGRRLAFGQPREATGIPLAVYDFDSGETRRIGIIPDAFFFYPLRWSADGNRLIFTAGTGEGRTDLWTLPTTPGSTAERLLSDAVLIDALPWGQQISRSVDQ